VKQKGLLFTIIEIFSSNEMLVELRIFVFIYVYKAIYYLVTLLKLNALHYSAFQRKLNDVLTIPSNFNLILHTNFEHCFHKRKKNCFSLIILI